MSSTPWLATTEIVAAVAVEIGPPPGRRAGARGEGDGWLEGHSGGRAGRVSQQDRDGAVLLVWPPPGPPTGRRRGAPPPASAALAHFELSAAPASCWSGRPAARARALIAGRPCGEADRGGHPPAAPADRPGRPPPASAVASGATSGAARSPARSAARSGGYRRRDRPRESAGGPSVGTGMAASAGSVASGDGAASTSGVGGAAFFFRLRVAGQEASAGQQQRKTRGRSTGGALNAGPTRRRQCPLHPSGAGNFNPRRVEQRTGLLVVGSGSDAQGPRSVVRRGR
jgi:hypothetical protein